MTTRSTGSAQALVETPFFPFVFATAARSAEPAALRELLDDALSRRAALPFSLLEAYADRCVAAGVPRRAIAAYRRAVVLEPTLPDALSRLLAMAAAAGRRVPTRWSRAADLLAAHRHLSLNAVVEGAARRCFGAVDHYRALAVLGETLRPGLYLEIGVDQGRSLDMCHPGARMIGVDPEPRLDPGRHPTLELHRTTSDAFFAGLPHRAPDLRFDLAFLDGLHEAGQLLRDFRETERRTRPGGCIVLHDVLPVHPVSAEPTRRLSFWVGDCWRLLCLLARARPDLDIVIVSAPPSGLAVIRNLDPGNRVLFRYESRLYDRLAGFDLGRDLVPTVLGLPWLDPDPESLGGFLRGRRRPVSGWRRFRIAPGDLHALMAARGIAAAGDPATAVRLRLVVEPAATPAPGALRRLAADGRPDRRVLVARVRRWASCAAPSTPASTAR